MDLSWRRPGGFWTGAELLRFAVGTGACQRETGSLFHQLVCVKSVKGTHTSQSEPTAGPLAARPAVGDTTGKHAVPI